MAESDRTSGETTPALQRRAFAFSQSPSPMALLRAADGVLVEVNEAFCRLFELSEAEALGHPPADLGLVSPPVGPPLLQQLQRTGRVVGVEVSARTRQGKHLDLLLSGEFLELEGVAHLVASLVDLTARKRAEQATRENERRFLEVAEHMHQVLWLADLDSAELLYISPAFDTIAGRPREELYASPSRFLAQVHPDDLERLGTALKTRPGDRSELDFRIIRPDGAVRSIHSEAFLVPDGKGKAGRVGGIATDVTEARSLAEQVRQAQKLESIGQLAGGMAHDFNNLLTVISSSNQFLRSRLGRADAMAFDLTKEIDAAVSRATGLTKQLLAFSRQQVISPAVLDINDVVSETCKLLGRVLGEGVRIITSLGPGLPEVLADAGQLGQTLLNLAINARDAMPNGGTLTIATTSVEVDERFSRGRLGLKAGRYVELTLSDTGQGMTKEVQAHLFEPFFTTKPPGQGTGLGLAVVFGSVQQAGGYIEAESEPGQGTTFRIYLPACTQAAKLDQLATPTSPEDGNETLLVVEDEESVRWVAIRGLRAHGYDVLEAASAREAMQLLEQHRSEVALIVTDVVMPEIDGRQLSLMARKLCPDLPVLFTSGFTDDTVIRHGIQHDQVPFLEKPYSPHTLARKVRQVLDEHRAKQPTARSANDSPRPSSPAY